MRKGSENGLRDNDSGPNVSLAMVRVVLSSTCNESGREKFSCERMLVSTPGPSAENTSEPPVGRVAIVLLRSSFEPAGSAVGWPAAPRTQSRYHNFSLRCNQASPPEDGRRTQAPAAPPASAEA